MGYIHITNISITVRPRHYCWPEANGQVFQGQVVGIDVTEINKQRLYKVKYEDGDEEHCTEAEIDESLVAVDRPPCRLRRKTPPPKQRTRS